MFYFCTGHISTNVFDELSSLSFELWPPLSDYKYFYTKAYCVRYSLLCNIKKKPPEEEEEKEINRLHPYRNYGTDWDREGGMDEPRKNEFERAPTADATRKKKRRFPEV